MNQENNWILDIIKEETEKAFKKDEEYIRECFVDAGVKYIDKEGEVSEGVAKNLKVVYRDELNEKMSVINGVCCKEVQDKFLDELEKRCQTRRIYLTGYYKRDDEIPGLEAAMDEVGIFNIKTLYDLSVYVVQSYINGRIGDKLSKMLDELVEKECWNIVGDLSIDGFIDELVKAEKKAKEKKKKRKTKIMKKKGKK